MCATAKILKRPLAGLNVVYIDTEWIASPMFKAARLIRGGEEVGWSTSMIFNYLPIWRLNMAFGGILNRN